MDSEEYYEEDYFPDSNNWEEEVVLEDWVIDFAIHAERGGPSHNSHQLKMRVLFLYTEKDPRFKHESFSLGYGLLKLVTILYSLLLIL